ncbi:MAG: FliG C-terminal domain-containing protein [Novosphingobium sp.]
MAELSPFAGGDVVPAGGAGVPTGGAGVAVAADGVKDEISARGRLKMADVLTAQKAIVAVARRLAAEGTIVFGVGGGDDEYV